MIDSATVQTFMQGLGYRPYRSDDDAVLAERVSPSGKVDHVHVRWEAREVSKAIWKVHLESFRLLKKKGAPSTRIFVCENARNLDVEVAREAKEHRVEVLSAVEFLDKFFGLRELADEIIRRIKGVSEQETKDFETLQKTYTEQDLHIEDRPSDRKAPEFILHDWYPNVDAQVLVLLAPAGHGKTALTKWIAYKLLEKYKDDLGAPVPLLIPFGTYRKLFTYRALVLEYFEEHKKPISMDAFNVMLNAGRLLVILDGFDELCEQTGMSLARENLRTLAEGLRGRGKVILTSRTTFFRTNVEGVTIIKNVVGPGKLSVAELQPFDDDQRKDFVVKLSGSPHVAERIMRIVRGVSGVEQVAGSPFLLKQLFELYTAADAEDEYSGPEKSSSLYEWMLFQLCEREQERQQYPIAVSVKKQIAFLGDISRWLFEDTSVGNGEGRSEGLPGGTVNFLVECNLER